MSDHDDAQDYTANGPTDIGFRTGGDGTGIKNGVVATGIEIGVHGKGGTGVVGETDSGTAVEGISREGTGVSGLSIAARVESIGVSGSSRAEGGKGVSGSGTTGVEGFGNLVGVHGEASTGTGVEGISDSGAGVVGKSNFGVGGFFNSLSKEALVGVSGGPGNGVRGSADSGSGVRGDAKTGFGVFGFSEKQSGVVGRSNSNVAPGVFGSCDKLTGVAGRSLEAPGVFGDSAKQAGVLGRSALTVGVFGLCEAPFKAPAPPAGVFGVNDNSVGVVGSSLSVIGVWGNTDKGLGVVGTANFGAGAPTERITDQGIGVIGLGNSGFGVAGMSTSGTGVFGSSTAGLAGHFKGPVTIEGDLTIIGGAKSAAVPHPDGSLRQLYCMESPESWFEDFGEARLVKGKAEVRLDPGFAALIKAKNYHVFVTPYGDCKGMFVTKRSATGFRVSEQQGGTSNVRFAYRVIAKRKGVIAHRLAKVTLPEVSSEVRSPKLRLKMSTPDLDRLSVSPLDLPGAGTGQ